MKLPDLFPFHGDWQEYVDALYAIYEKEIAFADLRFNDMPVKSQYRPPTDGKGYGFWHVISDGPIEEDRIPDFRRCERIRWIAWVIEQAEKNERIKWWKNRRGKDTHIVLWLEQFEFAVILAERRNYYLLKTAYVVKPHREQIFRKEFEKFWKAKNG